MKKAIRLYLLCTGIMFFAAFKSNAQYHITAHNFSIVPDSSMPMCGTPSFYAETDTFLSTLSIQTFYGDGFNDTWPLINGVGGGHRTVYHPYRSPGYYTIKQVLLNGTSRIDSVVYSIEYFYCQPYCQTFMVWSYYDANNNCVVDPNEGALRSPVTYEVSRAGVPIDTFTTWGGFYYTVTDAGGTVYSFKILSSFLNFVVACPSSLVIYDTVGIAGDYNRIKCFGFQCSGSAGIDFGINGSTQTVLQYYISDAIVTNTSCTPQSATVVMHASEKYSSYYRASPVPTSIAGHVLTWDLSGISLLNPKHISVCYLHPVPGVTVGDTVHTYFSVSPTAGDIDLSNNAITLVSKIKGSHDPNNKDVTPTDYVLPGTKLTYTIHFENTGNDTAFNIHIMDTLSPNLDIKTLDIITASAQMNLALVTDGGSNVARFDFPNINLLDSSHYGLCDGFVQFSIKTKAGLPLGTIIPNRGGIYFDYNDVVMTNTVQNIIGWPASVEEMSNIAPAEAHPNPVNDELYVPVDNSRYHTISITNMLGQELLSQTVHSSEEVLNVKSLPAGLYILRLKGENGIKAQRFEKL